MFAPVDLPQHAMIFGGGLGRRWAYSTVLIEKLEQQIGAGIEHSTWPHGSIVGLNLVAIRLTRFQPNDPWFVSESLDYLFPAGKALPLFVGQLVGSCEP